MKEIDKVIYKIITFLLESKNVNGFKGRSFYGEAFMAASLALYDEEKYRNEIIGLLKITYKQNKLPNSTKHWEFNNYAMLSLSDNFPYYKKFITNPLVYGTTESTNWILLRQLCKCFEGNKHYSHLFNKTIKTRQLENGLILDAKNVSSFQYHCFSAVLLYEIYSQTQDITMLKRFYKAAEFMNYFTLRDGESLYIGRGQEQIFGYGCLIYMYTLMFQETQNLLYLYLRDKVIGYVFNQYPITLVKNNTECFSEQTLNINDIRHLGWYSYNNYFDYLPFFLFFIIKAKKIKSFDEYTYKYNGKNYFSKYFISYKSPLYDAVLACYPGSVSNSQLLPYIVDATRNISPCYGGEQECNCTLYPAHLLPVPYFKADSFRTYTLSIQYLYKSIKKYFKKRETSPSVSIWDACTFTIEKAEEGQYVLYSSTHLFSFKRVFQFRKTSILIEDQLEFKQKYWAKDFVPFNLSFYQCQMISEHKFSVGGNWVLNLVEVACKEPLVIEENGYCAKGKLFNCSQHLYDTVIKKGELFTYKYVLGME